MLTGAPLLAVVVLLPFVAMAGSLRLAEADPSRARRLSVLAALGLTLLVSLASVDVALELPAGRQLVLVPSAQFGVQLLGLAMLGLALSLADESPALLARWLPTAWASVGGLVLALLVTSLPVALLLFVGAALVWAFGLPEGRRSTADPVLRYAALLALAMPLLLAAFRLAELRSSAGPDLERLVLALAVPGFGLVLGLIPLHAWTLTLAGGTPRAMLFGVLTLVETAGVVLLLRTLAAHPWMAEEARWVFLVGGALSACAGGWLALSSPRDDPDDWLVYAVVANGGMLLAGLGTQSKAAAAGVALLLFARVLALVVLALAPRAPGGLGRVAEAVGTLALAGTPGLAGFPGLWLMLRPLQQAGGLAVPFAVLAGSGLLFATAVRRWSSGADAPDAAAFGVDLSPGGRTTLIALFAVLVVVGIAPGLVAPAFAGALRGMFLPEP